MSVIKKLAKPKFYYGQIVEFIGGCGTIINCHPDSGSWSYLVQMAMDTDSQIVRMGYETTVWLLENDISILFDL